MGEGVYSGVSLRFSCKAHFDSLIYIFNEEEFLFSFFFAERTFPPKKTNKSELSILSEIAPIAIAGSID